MPARARRRREGGAGNDASDPGRPRPGSGGATMKQSRSIRGALVALGTVAVTALALGAPLLSEGEAWQTAQWAIWPRPLGERASIADWLAWAARGGRCIALAAAPP